MIIKEIHISSFGKIINKDYTFSEINAFCEENGYGKSTICAFLKAIFYGLKQVKSNAKAFEDRIHFFPIEKDSCGGSLTYKKGSDEIRIERSFGRKSNDTLVVYKNNTRVDNPMDYTGEALFGIDEEAFLRTIFTDNKSIDTGANASISEKLSQTVEVVSLENIYQKLEKAEKEYKKALKELEENERELIIRIVDYSKIDDSLATIYQKYNDLANKQKKLKETIEDARANNQKISEYEEYNNKLSLIAIEEQRKERLLNKYPNGLINDEDLELIKKNINLIEKNKVLKSSSVLQHSEELEYNDLKRILKEEIEEQTFHRIQALISELERKNHLRELSKDAISKEEEKIYQLFCMQELTDEEIKEIEKQKDQYIDISKKIEEMEKKLGKPSKSKPLSIVFLVCALLLFISGIVMLILKSFEKFTFGIVLCAISIVFCLLSIIFFKKYKKESDQTELNNQRLLLSSIIKFINPICRRYQISTDNGLVSDVLELLSLWNNYLLVKSKIITETNKQRKNNEEITLLQNKLEKIFIDYNLKGNNYQDLIIKLRVMNDRFINLYAKKETFEKNREMLEQSINDYDNEIKAVLEKYQIEEMQYSLIVDEVNSDKVELETIEKQIINLKDHADKYKQEKKISDKPLEKYVNVSDLEETYNQINKSLIEVDNQIKEREEQINALEELKRQQKEINEEIQIIRKKRSINNRTIEIFKEAENNLKQRYIEPIKDSFNSYYDKLSFLNGLKVIMDQDYKVSVIKNGVIMDEKHLSTGEHTLLSFCFRLAMIDNIYKTESPFIILDDPLMSLDEKNLLKAKELIEFISKKMQVIYFTCHSSRNIL